MALSQANSEVNGDNACNGSVRVCLQHDNGTPYYDQYDIGGGPATNAPGGYTNTGFQSGSSTNAQTNYATENAKQCFDLNYTPASGSTSDILVIQPTDASNNPIGNAIALDVTHASCDSSGCECEDTVFEYVRGEGPLEIRYQDLGLGGCTGCSLSGWSYAGGGGTPFTFQTSGAFPFSALGSAVDNVANGDYPFTYNAVCDGTLKECTLTIRVVDGDDPDGCIDVNDSSVDVQDTNGNVLPINQTPGTTIRFLTQINENSGGLSGYFLTVKDPTGAYSGNPAFVSSSTDGQLWEWTIPSDPCMEGLFRLCVNPPQGSACPAWEPVDGRFSVTGCSSSGCDGFTNNPITVDCGETVTLSVFIDEADGSPSTSTPNMTVLGGGGTLGTPTSIGNGVWEVDFTAPACPASATNELIRVNWLRQGGVGVDCFWPYSVENASCNANVTATISGTSFQAGDSADLSAIGCDCPSYTLEWYLFSGGPYDGSTGGFVLNDSTARNTSVDFTKDGEYEFRVRCCPPGVTA